MRRAPTSVATPRPQAPSQRSVRLGRPVCAAVHQSVLRSVASRCTASSKRRLKARADSPGSGFMGMPNVTVVGERGACRCRARSRSQSLQGAQVRRALWCVRPDRPHLRGTPASTRRECDRLRGR